MDLIKHGGGREGGEGKGGKVSVCQAEFPLQQLCSSAWESCCNGATPHTPHKPGLPPPLHLLLMVQLTVVRWAGLSIILISLCFSCLFSPGSHGNPHVVVWLQCCCRRSPGTVTALGRGGAALTSNAGTHRTKNLLQLPSTTQAPS